MAAMATRSLFFPLLLFSLFFSLSILPHFALENTTTLQCIDLGQLVLDVTPSPLPGSSSGHGSKEVSSCECVQVSGLSRLKLRSYASAIRVTVVPSGLDGRIHIYFHCDVSGPITVFMDEEPQLWRLACLAIGFLLLLLAPMVSNWVPFYYNSSMVIGILLIIINLLFQKARQARRALKELVKMQTLVRGHIVWKRIVGWMHQIQVLMRAQVRARAQRSQILESSQSSSKSSHFQHIGPTTREEVEHGVQSYHYSFPDPINHSISNSKDSIARQMVPSPPSGEVKSLSPLKFSEDQAEDGVFWTAENSPQFSSASSRGGRSRRRWDLSRRDLSIYSSHPNSEDQTKDGVFLYN